MYMIYSDIHSLCYIIFIQFFINLVLPCREVLFCYFFDI